MTQNVKHKLLDMTVSYKRLVVLSLNATFSLRKEEQKMHCPFLIIIHDTFRNEDNVI